MGPPGTGERQLGTQQRVPWPRPPSGDLASGQICGLRTYLAALAFSALEDCLASRLCDSGKSSKAERAHTCRGSDMHFLEGSNAILRSAWKTAQIPMPPLPVLGAEFHAVVPLQTRRKILGFTRRMSIDFRRQHLIALLASNEESRRQLFANADGKAWLGQVEGRR